MGKTVREVCEPIIKQVQDNMETTEKMYQLGIVNHVFFATVVSTGVAMLLFAELDEDTIKYFTYGDNPLKESAQYILDEMHKGEVPCEYCHKPMKKCRDCPKMVCPNACCISLKDGAELCDDCYDKDSNKG